MTAALRMVFLLVLPLGPQISVNAQAPVITREPSDIVMLAGCRATFVVEAEGAMPLAFQWFRDGEPIPDATESVFSIFQVPMAYNGATFHVEVSNMYGSARSRAATLIVEVDLIPPVVIGARTGNNLQQVFVTFSGGGCGGTPMDGTTVSDPYNYSFAGALEIFGAQFIPPNIGVLSTSTQTAGTLYTLTVEGVADQTGNLIAHTEVSFTASVPVSPAPPFRWARRVPGGDDDGGYGVAADRVGNFYLTTTLWTNATLQGVELIGAGVYVAAYDQNGNLLRAFKGSTSGGRSDALAVDDDGNIFVAGSFYGATWFGSVRLINNHSYRSAPFLAKYSPTGTGLWAKVVPENSVGWSAAVAVDQNGNSYVSGTIGSYNAFVAKYDSQGKQLWLRTAGGTNYASSIAVDKDTNCIISGWFTAGAQFGNVTLTAASGARAFLAKYDANGTVLWARAQSAELAGTSIYATTVDPNGNIYATGNFSSSPGADVFVAKYNPDGRQLWVRTGGGSFNDIGFAIATDPAGSCYVAGVMQGSAAFGPFVLVDPGTNYLEEAFVLKLDANGQWLWAKQAGGVRDDYAYAIALNHNGNAFLAGYFATPANFDALTLTTDSERGDSFIAVIAPDEPRLEIARAIDHLELSWPLWASHFRLEAANALGLWSPANLQVHVSTNRVRANVAPSGPRRFFRLIAP